MGSEHGTARLPIGEPFRRAHTQKMMSLRREVEVQQFVTLAVTIARLRAGAPHLFANSKHELVGEEPREKDSGKIHRSGRRREPKTDG